MLAHPEEEPLDHAQRDDEGDHETDCEHNPTIGGHDHIGDGGAGLGVNLLDQVPSGGGDHGGNGDEEAELQGGGAVEADQLTGSDGGHGARGAGENRRERLAEADPDGLKKGHLLNVVRAGFAVGGPDVDDPHDDAADEQRVGHGLQAAQVLFAPLVQQKGGNRGEDKGDGGERDGVVQPVAVAAFALGEGAEESDDAAEEEQTESQDGA
jgi:hypothetical protein